MKIKTNGNLVEVSDGLSLTQFLKEQDVEQPDMVSVELNGEILSRDSFNSVILKDEDQVEFLYFMGGGSL